LSGRKSVSAVLLLWGACAAVTPLATAQQTGAPRMTVVVGKGVSGTIYKKLGLPERRYCWEKSPHSRGAKIHPMGVQRYSR